MDSSGALLVVALLTLPWWKRILGGLWSELWFASEPAGDEFLPTAPDPGTSGGIRESSRQSSAAPPSFFTSSGRARAFRSQPVPVRARARWQGGFGRRGL